jgi:formylglycine-generating enzyme required for sulfatase activity
MRTARNTGARLTALVIAAAGLALLAGCDPDAAAGAADGAADGAPGDAAASAPCRDGDPPRCLGNVVVVCGADGWVVAESCGRHRACLDGACVCPDECARTECGQRGCFAPCGACADEGTCTDGRRACYDWVPDCADRPCGVTPRDGLAWCDACPFGQVCGDFGDCIAAACQPDCDGRVCGADPRCGHSCGRCAGGAACVDGRCQPAECHDGRCLVPAGRFLSGCQPTLDPDCRAGEAPAAIVTLPAFLMGRTEVSAADYTACVDAGACTPLSAPDGAAGGLPPSFGQPTTDPLDPRRPANFVTFDQAAAYCAWSGGRLCTEREWEKAARGDDGRPFPWGDFRAACGHLNCGPGVCGYTALYEVDDRDAAAGASPYGALQMAGNVAEWVVADPAAPGPTRPDGTPDPDRRVLRGGDFTTSCFDGGRVSARVFAPGAAPGPGVGIRCCFDLPAAAGSPAPAPAR